MKMKKFLRGPWLWIGLAIGVMLVGSQLMTAQQFTKVDTQVGLDLIESGKAKTVKIFDGAQRVDVTLSNPDPEYGEQVQFFYVR
jgi:cell division protease FtsH